MRSPEEIEREIGLLAIDYVHKRETWFEAYWRAEHTKPMHDAYDHLRDAVKRADQPSLIGE